MVKAPAMTRDPDEEDEMMDDDPNRDILLAPCW
jgi:hypothetical protein